MKRQLLFQPAVLDKLRALEREDRRRIGFALTQYVETGHGDVKRLRDYQGQLRLRVGDWRIRFIATAETITVVDVSRRDKAYT
jgi:mRNA interferase RelE/StbE